MKKCSHSNVDTCQCYGRISPEHDMFDDVKQKLFDREQDRINRLHNEDVPQTLEVMSWIDLTEDNSDATNVVVVQVGATCRNQNNESSSHSSENHATDTESLDEDNLGQIDVQKQSNDEDSSRDEENVNVPKPGTCTDFHDNQVGYFRCKTCNPLGYKEYID